MDDKHLKLIQTVNAMEDHVMDIVTAELRKIKERVCDIYGHQPTMDHWKKPEHDHCYVCDKPMPGEAPR